MKKNNQKRTHMKVGDHILINKWLRKVVYLVARVDIPHSSERAFVTRSGGDFTIGLRVWKSDYAWNEKTQMWTLRR
jgi:hypothetical protein